MFAPSVRGDSLLTAQSFPKTFNDLSFVDRIEVKRAGYAPWESEYDPQTKRCIKNCVYPGLTIEEELTRLERETRIAEQRAQIYNESQIYNGQYPTRPQPAVQTTGPIAPTHTSAPSVTQTTPVVTGVTQTAPAPIRCNPSNEKIPPTQDIPYGNPLTGNPRVTSPYGERTHPVTGKPDGHRAIDFAAPIGTNVYSPANGTVERVWTDQNCGRGMRIQHAAGFSTLYCHLSEHLVKQGDRVNAGCLVAKTGNTGRSTGPHLHYGINSDATPINPTGFVNKN